MKCKIYYEIEALIYKERRQTFENWKSQIKSVIFPIRFPPCKYITHQLFLSDDATRNCSFEARCRLAFSENHSRAQLPPETLRQGRFSRQSRNPRRTRRPQSSS